MRTGETLLSSAREVGIWGPREPATAALKSLGPHYSFQPYLECGEAGSSSAHIGRGGSIALPPPLSCVCLLSDLFSVSHPPFSFPAHRDCPWTVPEASQWSNQLELAAFPPCQSPLSDQSALVSPWHMPATLHGVSRGVLMPPF